MARYRSYGKLDNPHATDGDAVFVRWVSRINPEQLQTGELAYSQNGRMDNDRTWQPRNGLTVFSPALDLSSSLNYEFSYSDDDPPEYDDGAINGVYGVGAFQDPSNGAVYVGIVTNTKMILRLIDDNGASGVGDDIDVAFAGGETVFTPVGVVQALDKVFIFRGDAGALEWDADTSGTPEFTAVTDTATTVTVDDAEDNAVVSDGVVTVSAAAHGRSAGDIVTVYYSGTSDIKEEDSFEIYDVTDDTYKFRAEALDGTYTLTLGGKQPLSGGYIAMPDPPWGVFHQGRLIVPYQRNLETGVSRDELVFSDIFDTNTYDPILNQFRFSSGSADYIVGVSPLLDDRLLVFCRRSVHLVTGISGSLDDANQTEITREVGCVARNTIREIGGTIMWLSDQGVYSITYGQELNLIANAIPISEPIENYMRQINWQYASNAIAVYNDNRYYLAVPLGSSTVNNAVFVYNFLNQGWESVDTYPAGFDILDAVVAPKDGINQVFMLTRAGSIHLQNGLNGVDRYELESGNTQEAEVEGRFITRRYTLGSLDVKRFSRLHTLAESRYTLNSTELPMEYKRGYLRFPGGVLGISYTTKDPDSKRPTVVPIESVDIEPNEDYSIKTSVRKRGYGIQFIYDTNLAKVRACTVEGITSSNQNVNRK